LERLFIDEILQDINNFPVAVSTRTGGMAGNKKGGPQAAFPFATGSQD
jgi:hypothetical protein